jgi:hypothetical protein
MIYFLLAGCICGIRYHFRLLPLTSRVLQGALCCSMVYLVIRNVLLVIVSSLLFKYLHMFRSCGKLEIPKF